MRCRPRGMPHHRRGGRRRDYFVEVCVVDPNGGRHWTPYDHRELTLTEAKCLVGGLARRARIMRAGRYIVMFDNLREEMPPCPTPPTSS